jgi:hypothetical protein
MELVTQTLGHVTLAAPVRGSKLTMYPLIDLDAPDPDYELASIAFANETLEVREVSESGAVPTLLVQNHGARPVLLVDGEELIGAKQNRVLNVTVMAPPGATIEVPVSCVEAGRWHYTSMKFRDALWLMEPSGRTRKMRDVTGSLRRNGSRAGNQREVWNHIAEVASELSVHSPTSAQEAFYSRYRDRLDREVERIEALPHQVGAAFAVLGRIAGLELFDASQTFSALLPKLVRSYALDGIGKRTARPPGRDRDAAAFIDRLNALTPEHYPAVGLGSDVRLTGTGIVAAGLVVNERFVHLSAFPGEN